jgi:hypothetical protein
MTPFLRRITRAGRLDPMLYEEVEVDQSAFGQAVAVVVLSSVATMVGLTGRFRFAELVPAVAVGLFAWASWSAVAFAVGARIFPEPQTRADWGELLRTTGFATAPGMLSFLGIFPVFEGFITFVASVWILLAFSVAVQQALDYRSTLRALLVCFAGWAFYAGMLMGFKPQV